MTLAEITDLVKNVGVPTVFAGFLLWRIEPLLKELIAAVRDVSDPDKTAARLTPLFKEQAEKITHDVTHDMRGALGKLVSALRDGR